MRQIIITILTLVTVNSFSQKLEIITTDKSIVSVTFLDNETRQQLLVKLNGIQDNELRKKWTSRTYRLSDNRILVEFYDKQAVIVNSALDFKKLLEVRFVKNTVWNLKKNVSYEIPLSYEQGISIVREENPKRLSEFKSEMPEYFDFEVYQLNTGQILYIDKSEKFKSATIYLDLKTLSSENTTIQEQYYGSDDDERLMKELASGDPLLDYEPSNHLIYPQYEKDLIRNHKLSLVETKVFVDFDFYGNLYKSENGYYILLDDFNQLNVPKTAKIEIGTLRVYNTLDEVRTAQRRYEEYKNQGVKSEHFYQKISSQYGKQFPEFVPSLIDSLPNILNFDKSQLTLDEKGLEIIDEAIKWNGTNYALFDKWFPSVLAYYGQFFIVNKNEGKWTVKFDNKHKVWIPEIILNDNTSAFDSNDFYKSMCEGPIPMKWSGDFDQSRKKLSER